MSIFYPDTLTARIRHNCENQEWARNARDRIVRAAQPWKDCPDTLLWASMFGPTLKRSWQVWSSGHCPSCKGDTPMYDWIIDPSAHAWKVQCPHCEELFPKNDFKRYYDSGQDEHGVFDYALADASLLVNDGGTEFGIDDANGYHDGENTWMFIATYLIYGQWKQLVHAGIVHLANAYTVTGDIVYARKCGILLDRVADLYPEFDFKEQGWLYEKQPDFGYVTNWHDACKEVCSMANAYDQVKAAILEDAEFLTFVQVQKTKHNLPFPKESAADVATHIEQRIFQDTITNVHKIKSNFPGQEIALITMHAVLSGTLETDPIQEMMDTMIAEAVAVDGVTGEKGLENYSAGVLQTLSEFLELLERRSPGFLDTQIERHPRLAKTYRFHIDTWCLEKFYPSIGDSGTFASEAPECRNLPFSSDISLTPSAYSFAWHLYEITKDPDYVRIMHRANGNTVESLPYDISNPDPTAFQSAVQKIIDSEGTELARPSINFEEWHLAILRSGKGEHERNFYVSYDTGRRHGHLNGLSIGLFARGLDLLPDFGYLPVHRGGWQGPHVDWYKSTAAHNTVTIDHQNQAMDTGGQTQIWRIDAGEQVIKISASDIYGVQQYERTCVLVDIDEEHFYIIDRFDITGGSEHAFWLHGPESSMTTAGLNLVETEPYGHITKMRNDRIQSDVSAGWSATWKHAHADVNIRYTGLTGGVSVRTAESWVSAGKWTYDDLWIPTLAVSQKGEDGLVSSFVGVLDVFGDRPALASFLQNEGHIEATLTSGETTSTLSG